MVALYKENILMFMNFAKKYLELHKYQLYFFSPKKLDTPYIYCLGINFYVNKFVTCNCNCNKKCILKHRMLQVRCFLKVCTISDIVAFYKEDILELRILQKLHNFANTNTKF